jgi:hypothetical protein
MPSTEDTTTGGPHNGVHRKTLAVTATVLSLAGGGGVAWACMGTGEPGAHTTTTGTTGTGTTTTTTTTGTQARLSPARAGGATRSSRPDRSPLTR